MRYVVILKTKNGEMSVFEDDDITRCFRWIADQAKKTPAISIENYRVADRDFEQSAVREKEGYFRANKS